jgi:hypothetical protein
MIKPERVRGGEEGGGGGGVVEGKSRRLKSCRLDVDDCDAQKWMWM